MKRLLVSVFLCSSLLSTAVYAEQADVNVGAEVQTEEGFFSRTWTNIKGFFAGDEEAAEEPAAEATTADESASQANAEVNAEAEADGSLVDSAAEKTKAGVDWTADKAKKGAEWTKETAKDVTKATGKGIKKTGEAIEGLFPDKDNTTVDAEAQVDAEVETE